MRSITLGRHLQILRLHSGLSQFQLGRLIGVTDKAISKWENDEALPRVDHCIKLARVFRVSLDDLLQIEFEENKNTIDPEDLSEGKEMPQDG